mmetsp:Transcript_3599/g.7747  ORF Transcript_3599/g.7747 Transcript_3599/m.7747 type:complete len:80 (+) Transcript_3599:77-316(+)
MMRFSRVSAKLCRETQPFMVVCLNFKEKKSLLKDNHWPRGYLGLPFKMNLNLERLRRLKLEAAAAPQARADALFNSTRN